MRVARTELRSRLFKRFLLPNAILFAAILLLVLLGEHPPVSYLALCPLHLVGLYCPTCGMTRAARALLRLDLAAALSCHPLLPLFLAAVLYYEVAWLLSVIRGRTVLRRPRLVFWITVAAFLGYFVLRNVLLLGFGIDPLGDFSS